MQRIIIICLLCIASSALAQSLSVPQDFLRLTSPNGGEKFYIGSDTAITWAGIPLMDTVKLDYSTDAGESWNFITDKATGGFYQWHVPKTVSDCCLVRAEQLTENKGTGWAKEGEGSIGGNDYNAIDSLGNIYTIGTLTNIKGSTSSFLVKYNPNGDKVWAAQIFGEVWVRALACDALGDIYITGRTGSADFGGINISVLGGNDDIFLAKYHPDGTAEWVKNASGSAKGIGQGLALDNTGNIYVTGYFDSTLIFDGNILISKGQSDIFIVKYHSDGIIEWAREDGGSGFDEGTSVCTDGYGDIYITGFFNGLFINKYHSNGNIVWNQNMGSAYGRGITADRSNNIYITGEFDNTTNINGFALSSAGSSDIFIAKLHLDGAIEWAQRAGGNGEDYSVGIATDTSANIYITGGYTNTADFGGIKIISEGGIDFGTDIFVAKYHPNGNIVWAKRAGGARDDNGQCINIDASGNIYTSGWCGSTSNFGDTLVSDTVLGYELLFLWKIGSYYLRSDTSDTIFSIVKPKTVVSIKDDSGFAGDHKNIPMILEKVPITSVQSEATNFSARIAYDRTVLYPSSGNVQHGGRFDTVTVSGSIGGDSILMNLPFVTLLGEATSSPMNIVDFAWLDGSGQPADYDVETESGTFYMLGICPAGGTRLYNPDGQVSIAHINPNPSGGIIHIEIQTTETGRTQLELLNLLGQKVATISDGELKPGPHSFDFHSQSLTSGSYFLLFTTPTVRKMERVDIQR